jgi:hypothetical protein
MTKTIQTEYSKTTYNDTPEIRDKVFERVMKYFKEYECYSGEQIHQSDDPIIYAPYVLSDIADDIIKFQEQDLDDL